MLSELKAVEARVAMDDFGTGYSNLAYLQRLRRRAQDRSQLRRPYGRRTVLRRLSSARSRALPKCLGMRTTAEGETADRARLLSALGCDFGQGYLRAADGCPTAIAYWRQSLLRPII